MKTKITLSALTLSFLFKMEIINAQQFQRAYGINGGLNYMTEWGNSIKQTSDGGYIITGAAGSNPYYDPFLLKTDTFGNMQWYQVYNGNLYEGKKVIQTTDSGYIVTGSASSNGNDAFLLKVSATGSVQWAKTYGGGSWDDSYDVKQTVDGGYIFTGITMSFGLGNSDIYLVKTTSSGDTVWTKTFGGTDSDGGNSILQLQNGNFLIAGYTQSFGIGNKDIYLLNIDANGNLNWAKTLGDSSWSDQSCTNIIATLDGGFALLGIDDKMLLTRLDSTANPVWAEKISDGGFSFGLTGGSLIQLPDSGFIVSGEGSGNGNTWSNGAFLAKLTNSGSKVWFKTFGGSNRDGFKEIIQTGDGGYAAVGVTQSFGNGEIYLVRLNSDTVSGCNENTTAFSKPAVTLVSSTGGNVGAGCNITSVTSTNPSTTFIDSVLCNAISAIEQNDNSSGTKVVIFPNPFSTSTTVFFPNELKTAELAIYDVLGNEVRVINLPRDAKNLSIERENISEGIYFLQLKNENKIIATQKIVIQ